MEVDDAECSAANQAERDERVSSRVDGRFHDLPGFHAGGDSGRPFEAAKDR